MKGEELLEALVDKGALQKGHFKLSSGRHSDTYIQCARIFSDPELAVDIGRQLAAEFSEREIDLVLSPALGGIIPGFSVAMAIGCPMAFAERVEGTMKLRRGFGLSEGQRVLIVEDVVTTGDSVAELAELAEDYGAVVVGIAAVVLRGETPDISHELSQLVRIPAKSYPREYCSLCGEGIPMTAPGSRYS